MGSLPHQKPVCIVQFKVCDEHRSHEMRDQIIESLDEGFEHLADWFRDQTASAERRPDRP